ncbi:hypothetical protein N5D77_26285 [Comamonas thiooxydans]|uniref:Uncharacterized protein n=1 Tax=Comamonas thiooxydans TaxID=363952 RepID=A0AA42TWU3_9BURK|nr:hypothetical protein [Comamonas thiooxydans]MDH1337549.1 hypothetical protein [Comamonas thiooxydans]MDH1743552.1 hypothetical protein [Comamonas thiooxydans]MDH1790063.1 hypothetical protein [Comamonas thiooxydans]
MQDKQQITAAEQAAWLAGLDDGRAQAGFTVSNAEAPQAAPAAVAVPGERDPAALLQLADLLESGRHLIHVERKEIADAIRAALAATPAVDVPANVWQQAVDAELVSAHLGVAADVATLEDAKKALHELICWNIDVATNPATNGGKVLVAAAAPVVLPEPALYVSGGQLERHCDPEDKNGGRYIPARKTAAGLFATPLYTEQQVRALLATATGLPAQAVAYIDSEVLTSFLSCSNYRPADGWDCHIRHQENKRDTDVPLYSRPQAQADARDAERYRYLRGEHEGEAESLCVFGPNDMRECLVPIGSLPGELDAFIDAAIAAQAAQGGE